MPKQGGIQEAMNRFLAQYLPMLYRQRQREEYTDYSQSAYLERRMKEMEKMEEMDISAEDRARVRNMLQNFFSTAQAEAKPLPYGSSVFAERTGAAAKEFGLQPLPVDPELGSKTQRYAKIGQELALAKVSGAEPSSELVEEAISLFGLDAVVSEVAKFNDAAAKRIDQEHRRQEIGIKQIEAVSGKTTAETAAAEQQDQQRKDWLKFVTDIEAHLRAEGVRTEALLDMPDIFGRSGRVPDPLSPELRGQAYTYLGQIRAKLIQGEMPTAGEIRFLTAVRNSAKVSLPEIEGGGLPDPTKTQREIEVDEATIRAHMDVIREMTGETDEAELRRLAMEFLKTIK